MMSKQSQRISILQSRFAKKSLMDSKHRFSDMMNLCWNEEWIQYALHKVLTNTGARTSGIDGVNRNHFRSERTGKILKSKIKSYSRELGHRIKKGEYVPNAVRRVYIPKPSGGKRPLGIPTIEDRTVQMILKMILEPIFESDFSERSYGFRPARNPHMALRQLRFSISGRSLRQWAIEGDIADYFGSVNHDILMRDISRRIADERLMGLIRGQLEAGTVMQDGVVAMSDMGTPQGGVVSPLLSNIYLDPFDRWVEEEYFSTSRYKLKKAGKPSSNCYVRFADDWAFLTNGNKKQAEFLRDRLITYLEDERKLKVNKEKTALTHTKDTFYFLGYDLKTERSGKGWRDRVFPCKRAQTSFRKNIKMRTRRDTIHEEPYMKFLELSRVIKGWGNYFKHGDVHKQFSKLDWYVNQRVKIWLMKKHGKKPYKFIKKKYRKKVDRGYIAWQDQTGNKQFYVPSLRDTHPSTELARNKPYNDLCKPPDSNPYLTGRQTEIENPPLTEAFNMPAGYGVPKGHPGNWKKTRKKCLRRDGGKCVICGDDAVEVHGQDDYQVHSSISVCQKHHTGITNHIRKDGQVKIILDRHGMVNKVCFA